MTAFDPNLPPEERVRHAIAHGPDMDARGSFGSFTRLARRFVGRAVKYERDFNLQIDVALLEKMRQIEDAAAEQLDAVESRLREAYEQLRVSNERLRESDEKLRSAGYRAEREVSVLLDRVDSFEALLDELRDSVQGAETRAAVSNTIAAGAAEGLESLTRDLSETRPEVDALRARVSELDHEAGFVYDELTAMPYVADDGIMRFVDTDGRTRLGYRGGLGASPISAGFEEIFRGPEAFVRERQRVYLDVIADRGPVVDLGCGRGEMLNLLASAGIDACGVDFDEVMVDRARSVGATVHHGDALDFLMKQDDASLGAIFSAQFIEHVPAARLPDLFEIARAKLLPGGVFIAETVNPHSPRALKAFWVDPTHQHPLFPETLLALCRLTGFPAAEIMFPLGCDDLAADLRTCVEYAVIAGAREPLVVPTQPNWTTGI